MKYLVVYERAAANWSAYVPDLPGCVATAETLDEAEETLREAITFHIDGVREAGEAIPEASVQVGMVEAPGEPGARYLVVYEHGHDGYEAHAPDLLPECETTGATLDDVRLSMSGAVGEYVERLRRSGEALPKPAAQVGTIEVELAIA